MQLDREIVEIEGSPEQLVGILRREGIRDERILKAFGAVRRDLFLPPESRPAAYLDSPAPIGHGQVTTQPSLIARMLEGLQLLGDERVLEVGTGSGYQTALLGLLCREVYSIERFRDLAERARAGLAPAGVRNARLFVGDGTLGLPEHAPFDAIIVSAASPLVPQPLSEQLAEGGRLVQPIGPGGEEVVVVFRKRRTKLVRETPLTRAVFVPLVGEHGAPS
ncbi:MAG: protein-L-isoaspartate(D-aspartate) O-methyltransferase [Myxococcales bacterium]|nr:protein-L-isoaspartate(D-aspartate) O-methyltransferase [Myxococcales bacterium]